MAKPKLPEALRQAIRAHESLLAIKEGIGSDTIVSVPDLNDALEKVRDLIINTVFMMYSED